MFTWDIEFDNDRPAETVVAAAYEHNGGTYLFTDTEGATVLEVQADHILLVRRHPATSARPAMPPMPGGVQDATDAMERLGRLQPPR